LGRRRATGGGAAYDPPVPTLVASGFRPGSPVGAAARSSPLLLAADLAVGEFACPPGDPRWRGDNDIGPAAHVVFPRTHVAIAPERGARLVAGPTHAVLYRRGERYRRAVVDPRGDRASYVAVSDGLAEELRLLRGDGAPARRQAATDRRTYLLHRLACRALAAGDPPDGLLVEEAFLTVLGRTAAVAAPPRRGRARAATARAHAELAEGARALLAQPDAPGLAALARALHTSRFHLTRVFHAHTGYSLSAYRLEVRVRLALDDALGDRAPLTGVAARLGFASPSHLSDRFRAAFGVAPSRMRALAGAELDAALRRALAAAAAPP
jgi:AraC-like DNA-binding protein